MFWDSFICKVIGHNWVFHDVKFHGADEKRKDNLITLLNAENFYECERCDATEIRWSRWNA
jgi:hypothetical protein